jgi:methylated-DNA-protein-cysteine methyltransferase related protein
MTPFATAVAAVVRDLAPGEVVTYGEVALEAGYPGRARAVGNVLAASDGLPWWRVVTASGRLVPGAEREHEARLRADGVVLQGGRVSLARRTTRPARTPGGSGPVRHA